MRLATIPLEAVRDHQLEQSPCPALDRDRLGKCRGALRQQPPAAPPAVLSAAAGAGRSPGFLRGRLGPEQVESDIDRRPAPAQQIVELRPAAVVGWMNLSGAVPRSTRSSSARSPRLQQRMAPP